jgi:hypothetical protein
VTAVTRHIQARRARARGVTSEAAAATVLAQTTVTAS